MRPDLLIHAGRIVCPATGLDGEGAVAVVGDRIEAAGPGVDGAAAQVLRLPAAVVLPGLVDLHAHPGWSASKYAVAPDVELLPFGTTTVLSQGDVGADDWRRYRDEVIRPARTRVRLALNLSRRGESTEEGSFERWEDVDVAACVETIRADRRDGAATIWGIAVNVGTRACGRTDPRRVLASARAVSHDTGLPLLYGSRRAGDWSMDEQLALLRRGDVVTYCFNDLPEGLLAGGRVRDAAWGARERGVLFDVGHGMGSLSFPVAEQAIAEGFLPDTISTDRYRRHLDQSPRHDLPRTVSKLMAAGMAEGDAFARVTARPAEILGLGREGGTLARGSGADLVALAWNPAAAPLRDTSGAERPGGCWEPVLTVRAGVVIGLPVP